MMKAFVTIVNDWTGETNKMITVALQNQMRYTFSLIKTNNIIIVYTHSWK